MPISEVFNEDCMIGMARYPDKFFDLAIVDPPFGIGMDGNNNWSGSKHKKKDWDNSAPPLEYFSELQRVSKNQIIWGANHFISRMPYDTSCWIVWDKKNDGFSFADGELAWSSFSSAVRFFREHRSITFKEYKHIHPTQKPQKLYQWILLNYATCKKCDNTGVIHEMLGEKWMGTQDVPCEYCCIAESGMPKILDTHMGSQSSRIAAYLMGFDYYGWEIDSEYFEQGNKRFELVTSQQQLF